jgi:hypothetical protein
VHLFLAGSSSAGLVSAADATTILQRCGAWGECPPALVATLVLLGASLNAATLGSLKASAVEAFLLHGGDTLMCRMQLAALAAAFPKLAILAKMSQERARVPSLKEACRRAVRKSWLAAGRSFSELHVPHDGAGPSHLFDFLAHHALAPRTDTDPSGEHAHLNAVLAILRGQRAQASPK